MSNIAEAELNERLQPSAVLGDPRWVDGPPRANVLGVGVDVLTIEHALSLIANHLNRGSKGYVCAVDVHAILQALHRNEVADAIANAAIALPDGAPTVWMARLQGYRSIDHVTGPDIMREIFKRSTFAEFS